MKTQRYLGNFEPNSEKFLNYIVVKEQQKMKKSRMSLLNTLDRQRFKFKYNTDKSKKEKNADLNLSQPARTYR